MTHWYIRATSAVGSGTGRAEWVNDTTYAIGDRVVCTPAYGTVAARKYVYECTASTGKSHLTTQPTWPTTVGNTVVDNQVTWTCRAPTTWANASLYIDYLCYQGSGTSPWAAGDTFWVDNTSVATRTGGIYLVGDYGRNPGSTSVLSCIISTSDLAHEPPQSRAAGAIYRTSGDLVLVRETSGMYFYGIQFEAGYGASSGTPFIATYYDAGSYKKGVIAEECTFKLAYAVTDCRFYLSHGAYTMDSGPVFFKNCDYEFTHAGQSFSFFGVAELMGGAIQGTAPTWPVAVMNYTHVATVAIAGMDFSLCSSNLVNALGVSSHLIVISQCKLNAGVTLKLNDPYCQYSAARVHNCSASAQNFRQYIAQWQGLLTDETTIVRDDGATDGVTRISWKIVNGASASPSSRFVTPDIAIWNAAVGSPKTFTIEFLHDSVTPLTDADIWVEAYVLTDDEIPQATRVTSQGPTCFTPTDCPSSTAGWTTTGMSDPMTQKISVTATPNMAGVVSLQVHFGKTNGTVYVDPMITVS